jgi:hypothetical protein
MIDCSFLGWLKSIPWMIRYGDWELCWFKDFKIDIVYTYYDGYLFAIRLGFFSVCCYY